MGWKSHVCKLGHKHEVFHQEAGNSCGPSCGLMLIERATGIKLDASQSYLATTGYGTTSDGQQDAYDQGIAEVTPTGGLRMAGYMKMTSGRLTAYRHPALAKDVRKGVTANLKKKKPVIMGVMWIGDDGTSDNYGGHWVVVDKVTTKLLTTYACICDPGDGEVYTVKWGSALTYTPSYSTNGGRLDDYIEYLT